MNVSCQLNRSPIVSRCDQLVIVITIVLVLTLACSTGRARELAFDTKGNLFVMDSDSHIIFKFLSDGTKNTFATFVNQPTRMAIDSSDNLFVADSGGNISKLAPGGISKKFATGLKNPHYMTCDRKGNLFVSDSDSEVGSIVKFTPDGTKSTVATGGPDMWAFSLDSSGNLYLLGDRTGSSLLKITPAGVRITFASGPSGPENVVCDAADNLFVYDKDTGSILKFSPDGKATTFATNLKDRVDWFANNFLINKEGYLFASSDSYSAVLEFSPLGSETTIATDIRVNGLALDQAGDLFLDSAYAISKFTPNGTKSTFASDRVSPDKRCEYRFDQTGGRIMGPGASGVDLGDETGIGVLWSPDSKRFAFNSKGHHYIETTFYELRSGNWVKLRSPGDELGRIVDRAGSAEMVKRHVRQIQRRLSSGQVSERRQTLQWIDANTAIVHAGASWDVADKVPYVKVHFLFTLKFDQQGNWKIVETHQITDTEAGDV